MKRFILTSVFLLIVSLAFSQTNTDTSGTKSTTTTTTQSTKLVRKRVAIVPVKKVTQLKQSSVKTETPTGKKEDEEGSQPK